MAPGCCPTFVVEPLRWPGQTRELESARTDVRRADSKQFTACPSTIKTTLLVLATPSEHFVYQHNRKDAPMNTPDPFAQLLSLTHAPFSASRKMCQDVREFAAPQGMEEAAALTPGVQAKSA